MQRQIRRQDRKMEEQDARKLLEIGEYGILSTVSANGQPYGVPLSYIVLGDRIYFHCAMVGHKWDNIAGCKNVSFCVVGNTRPVYDNTFTTCYESVIATGEASLVNDVTEKSEMLTKLCEKYLPGEMDKASGEIAKGMAHTGVVRINITAISGKRRA